MIEVINDVFRIMVNGKFFVNFIYRIDFRKGKFFVLWEGVVYYDVIY